MGRSGGEWQVFQKSGFNWGFPLVLLVFVVVLPQVIRYGTEGFVLVVVSFCTGGLVHCELIHISPGAGLILFNPH